MCAGYCEFIIWGSFIVDEKVFKETINEMRRNDL